MNQVPNQGETEINKGEGTATPASVLDQIDAEDQDVEEEEVEEMEDKGEESNVRVVETDSVQAQQQGGVPTPPPAPSAPVPPTMPMQGNVQATAPEVAPVGIAPTVPTQTAPVAPRVVGESERDLGIIYDKSKNEMKAVLEAQPKVTFMIPKIAGEADELAYESVQLNGFRVQIKKGTMVQVPQQIAEVLAEKYQIEMSAGQEMRVNRDDTVNEALSQVLLAKTN